MYISEYKSIYFIEGAPQEAVEIEYISTEINGIFSQSQLRTLDDLKEKMIKRVLSKGGNCVVSFKYGQRSTFWKSLFGLDNVVWYGSGVVATMDPAVVQKYINT